MLPVRMQLGHSGMIHGSNPRKGGKWAYSPTPGNRNAEKRNVRKGDFPVTAARKMGRGKMSSYSLKFEGGNREVP